MTGLTIRGTSGFTFPLVSNLEWLSYTEAPKDGKWFEEKTGIKSHSLNFNCVTGEKLNNLTSIDFAEHAARQAMVDAGLLAKDIDHLCLATCTPSQIHFMADLMELHRRLGLRSEIIVDYVPGGCGALAKVFQTVETHARCSAKYPDYNALIVASNDTSSFFDKERYKKIRGAWLSPADFADGAAALVLGPGDDGLFLAHTYCAVDGSHPLMKYRGGGAEVPTRADTLDEHVFLMDARDVAVQFVPAMERILDHFLLHFQNISIETIERWYIHQANLRLIERFAKKKGIPMERVPHNVDFLGNTVSASTLLLLHQDIKEGKFPKQGPVIFMVVGAGMMEGGALFLG